MNYGRHEILTLARVDGRDLGEGHLKLRLRLAPGDHAHAPGITTKEFVATGHGAYIDYLIHPLCWQAEPNGFIILVNKGEL